jgi:hypothetical protein
MREAKLEIKSNICSKSTQIWVHADDSCTVRRRVSSLEEASLAGSAAANITRLKLLKRKWSF